MRVLVADKFEQSGLDGLKAAGCDVVYQPDLEDEDLTQAIRDTGADVVHSPLGFFRLTLMKERWSVYSSFFNWSFLFDRAEGHVVSSTYASGVFLKGMTVLLPVGIYHLARNRRTVFTMLVLAVFFCAPIAASLVNASRPSSDASEKRRSPSRTSSPRA